MPSLSKNSLLQKFTNAVKSCGWSVFYQGNPSEHPYRLLLSRGSESRYVLLYIWNLTFGGRRSLPDEYRIQITGVAEIQNLPGYQTLLLGYWQASDVFAGYDTAQHNGPVTGSSPSLQIRESALRQAAIDGFAIYARGREEVAVAFAPWFVMDYILRHGDLHNAPTEADQEALEHVARSHGQVTDDILKGVSANRQREIRQIATYQRASDFRRRILSAYLNTCAFCGIQLELVDAAHILPVASPGSTDETSNGLCVCSLHHRAFDRGLVAILPDYQIRVNRSELDRLATAGLDSGKEGFFANLRAQIILPAEPSLYPASTYIEQGLASRNLQMTQLVSPH